MLHQSQLFAAAEELDQASDTRTQHTTAIQNYSDYAWLNLNEQIPTFTTVGNS